MYPPYTEQAYVQYPSTPSHNSGSGYYPSHPRVTDFVPPVVAQRAAPSYNAQLYTTQDVYSLRYQPIQPAVRTGPGYGNDVYRGGSIPRYGSYHSMPLMPVAGSWGPPNPQYLQYTDYQMPSMPFSNFGEPYYPGYNFSTEQVPGPFTPRLPVADPDQDTASERRFHTCSVGRAKEDEAHLTYGNDAYGGGSISGHGSNDAMAQAGFWRTPAPQPPQNSDYSMPSSMPYSNFSGEHYYAGYDHSTEQAPGPSTNFPPHLPEADPNQDASSEGHFRTQACYQPYGGR